MADSTLMALSTIAEPRWDLFTTTQPETTGVARRVLRHMATTAAIGRASHGVYRMAGAPRQEHEAIYATGLPLDGATTAHTIADLVEIGTDTSLVAGTISVDRFVAPPRLADYLSASAKRRQITGTALAIDRFKLAGVQPGSAFTGRSRQ